MPSPYAPAQEPLTRMLDGTVKQLNPLTGTEVWTVPGRGNRPLGVGTAQPRPLDPARRDDSCAFCAHRYAQTPPEKARLVRDGDRWRTLTALPARELDASVAEFRRIPNLFEIVSFDYWHANYGYGLSPQARAHRDAYLADDAGRAHVWAVVRQRLAASGVDDAAWEAMGEPERTAHAAGFFGGGHDVIVARRHFVDGATTDAQLASSGTLTPQEHAQFIDFTVDAMRDLYAQNRYARYVAAFQNWLRPAGASFDHLHKQLVAIDSRGAQAGLELQRLRENTNLYNEVAVDYAARHDLLVAENEHAVAFAGFGHRYPTLEVYSKSPRTRPWELSPAERRAVSDLVHAVHAATGPDVPCNEEWHHQPPDVDLPMPWRIVLKWRVSTLAGFEGGTKIYLNTIDPWNLRRRVVEALTQLRGRGRLAEGLAIGDECRCPPNSLKYNPVLQWSAGG